MNAARRQLLSTAARIGRVEPGDRRRREQVGGGEADHLGEGQQQDEEQHQRRADQQIFDRRHPRAADDVEQQEGEEGEADEQEAVFRRAVDLRIEVDRLDQADLRGLRRRRSTPARPRIGVADGGAACSLIGAGVAGRDQRLAEREIADAVGGGEALVADAAARPAGSRRRSSGCGQGESTVQRVSPACGARLSEPLPRKSKAKSTAIGAAGQRRGVDPGEEAAPAGAAAAGLQPERPRRRRVTCGIGAEPARVAERRSAARRGRGAGRRMATPKRGRSGGMAKRALPATLAS